MAEDFAPIIWSDLMAVIGNEYGVAGLMGNLEGESGMIPFRVQGDFSANYNNSREYTKKVDNGQISEYDFVHNGPGGGGYGLAQWTYYTRKQKYYNLAKSTGRSIGSVDQGIDMLLTELKQDFPSVYETLKNATSIKQACDKVLYVYEAPANPDSLEPTRLQFSIDIYKRFTGTTPPVPPDPGKFDLMFYLLSSRVRRKRRMI